MTRVGGFSVDDGKRIAKVVRWFEAHGEQLTRRLSTSFGSDFIPLRLAKLRSGQSLDGTDPSATALGDIYSGDSGSEAVVVENVTIHQGRQLGVGETVDDTDWLVVAIVDNKWQLVSPRTTGGGGSGGGMIVVELPGDLAKTDATKASCTVKQTFTGGPSVSSTVTVTNPEAKGGNYQFRATAATQYVNAVWQGGSTYLIVSVQPVVFDPVDDVTWDGTDLKQVKRDIDIGFSGSTATTTIDTAVNCAE